MADSILDAVRLPPKDALAYFRQKENVPTDHWTDLWHEGHSKGFMVAGAASQALLNDLRNGVDRIVSQGVTMEEWRKEFPQIADRYGWKYNGSPGWRADTIYDTNMTTALSAGRFRRMTTPEALELYPFWRYTHHACMHPRPQHVAWDGILLPANDPWFLTHYPPNGWRCHCTVEVVSRAKMKRMGWEVSERPPVETRPWINPRNGTVHQVPVGIDPGFAYNPGLAWKKNEALRAGRALPRFVAEDAGPAHPVTPGMPVAPQTPPALPEGAAHLPEPAHLVSVPKAARPSVLTPEAQRVVDQKAVLDILHDPNPSGDASFERELPVGRIAPVVRDVLGIAPGNPAADALFSTEQARKQLREHRDLTDADYRVIPDMLANPLIVAEQGNRRAVFFWRGGRLYRATVKTTVSGDKSYLLTFHRTTPEKARQRLKSLRLIKGSLDDLEDGDVRE